MSKRKKKSRSARSQVQRSVPADKDPAPPSSTKAPAAPSTSQEYEHVTKDLRRVTILAAAMFALLFALSFFIG